MKFGIHHLHLKHFQVWARKGGWSCDLAAILVFWKRGWILQKSSPHKVAEWLTWNLENTIYMWSNLNVETKKLVGHMVWPPFWFVKKEAKYFKNLLINLQTDWHKICYTPSTSEALSKCVCLACASAYIPFPANLLLLDPANAACSFN